MTGGFGPHFNRSSLPHADYARSFALSLGIPPSAFADFALSSNTVEDALLALPTVERLRAGELVVVAPGFHIERTRYIFDRVFPRLKIRYAGSRHNAAPAAPRELTHYEARALAHLRAVRGSPRDPLSARTRRLARACSGQ